MKSKYRRLYQILVISSGIFAIALAHNSNPAIASYNHYVSPSLKVTRYFNPEYRNRFYPKAKNYLRPKTVTVYHKLIVRKPDKHFEANQQQQKIVQTDINTESTQLSKLSGHKSVLAKVKKKLIKHKIQNLSQRLSSLQARQKHLPIDLEYQKELRQKRHLLINPTYHIKPIKQHKIVYLKPNYPLWKAPYVPSVNWTSSTNRLAHDTQAMEIRGYAHTKGHTFYRLVSSGHNYGWAPKQALIKAHTYQMPFHYYDQLKPLYAPDACEAVSLRMALSVKGHDPQISMRKFIDRIPRSKNPNQGYTADPYKYGDGASIYPKALAKYGQRYDKHVYPFTGITKRKVIHELEDGNPVIYEGSYRMHDTDSDHTLVLIGYSDNSFKFADPFYRKDENKPISWVSIKQFTKLFHQPLRGSRAVIVK